MSRYHTLDFEAASVIVEAGYRHAQEHIAEWRRALPPSRSGTTLPIRGETQ